MVKENYISMELIGNMYRIERLQKKDQGLVNAICESLKTAYDPNIARFFVQQDTGYKVFFNAVLEHPAYPTYYVYHTLTNELVGFACFQIIENIVFLKHIVVNNELRGSKIGAKLLFHALHEIQRNSADGYFLFQLHVFEKNSRALSWYLSIGMEAIDCNYWYDLSPTIDSLHTGSVHAILPFHIEPDTFGFKQVSCNDLYIGTLLGSNTLIVKNELALNHLKIIELFVQRYQIQSIGIVSNKPLEFSLVDKALLMSKPIAGLDLAC